MPSPSHTLNTRTRTEASSSCFSLRFEPLFKRLQRLPGHRRCSGVRPFSQLSENICSASAFEGMLRTAPRVSTLWRSGNVIWPVGVN